MSSAVPIVCRTIVAALLCGYADANAEYPACVLKGQVPLKKDPVYTDVTRFIAHPDEVRHRIITFTSAHEVGMGLRDDPHKLGELVDDVIPGSQAEAAGVQVGWIIKEVDGKPFTKKERLNDVVNDFTRARKADSTLTVKFDMRTVLDCAAGQCSNSDRFPTALPAVCAEACFMSMACEWWSLTVEDTDSICRLSKNILGYTNNMGASSGARECVPDTVHTWPRCMFVETAFPSGPDSEAAFTDTRGLASQSGNPTGCSNNDCKNSDRFFVLSAADCAEACFRVQDCQFWAHEVRGGDHLCSMKSNMFNGARVSSPGAATGARSCRPNAVGGHTRWWIIAAFAAVALWSVRERLTQQFPALGEAGLTVMAAFQLMAGMDRTCMDTKGHGRDGRDQSELQSLVGSDDREGRGYF